MAIKTPQKYLFKFSDISVALKYFLGFFIVIQDQAFNDFEPDFP
jgi:hypothetical protein